MSVKRIICKKIKVLIFGVICNAMEYFRKK